jgi:ribosomal-protein-alanine N-acetyltransferase
MDLVASPLAIEPMQVAHVAQVMDIERESFSLPWPESAYRYEVMQNDWAHYYVLVTHPSAPSAPPDVSSWQRLWQVFRSRPAGKRITIAGYGGFWLMYDEAHISTLAVRIAQRGRGFGELLLIAMLHQAQRLKASRATLEVRVSNTVAQRLYAKYGFEQVGRRKAYYNDNREDALILTTPEFAAQDYQELIRTRQRELAGRLPQIPLDKILQID